MFGGSGRRDTGCLLRDGESVKALHGTVSQLPLKAPAMCWASCQVLGRPKSEIGPDPMPLRLYRLVEKEDIAKLQLILCLFRSIKGLEVQGAMCMMGETDSVRRSRMAAWKRFSVSLSLARCI